MARIAFSVLLFDCVAFDLFLFLRSLSKLASCILVLETVSLGSSLPSQQHARGDLTLLVFGLTRAGFVSLLLASDDVNLGFSLPVQGPAHLGFVVLVLDSLHMDSALFLQSPTCAGLLVSIFSSSRAGLSVLSSGESIIESPLFARSSFRLDFSLLVMDPAQIGLLSLLRSSG